MHLICEQCIIERVKQRTEGIASFRISSGDAVGLL